MDALRLHGVWVQPGNKYRLRYQIPGVYNRPREMVALVLSIDADPLSQSGWPKLILSGRPQYGSSDLNSAHVIEVKEVPQDTECYHTRKYNLEYDILGNRRKA